MRDELRLGHEGMMLRGVRHRRSGIFQAFAAFALLAMVVRTLVPAGFMVAPADHGGFISLTLCSDQGATAAFIDLETGAIVHGDVAPDPSSPGKSSNDGGPCTFAGVATLAAPEVAPSVGVALGPFEVASVAIVRVAPGRGLAAPPPWSTGPPLTV